MVSSLAPAGRFTIADLAGFPDDGKLRELVGWHVVEWEAPTLRHGFFAAALAAALLDVVRQQRLGRVGSGGGLIRIQGSEHDARGGHRLLPPWQPAAGSRRPGDAERP